VRPALSHSQDLARLLSFLKLLMSLVLVWCVLFLLLGPACSCSSRAACMQVSPCGAGHRRWLCCTPRSIPLRSPDMKTCTTNLGVTASKLVVHATSSHVFGRGLRRICHSVLHGHTFAISVSHSRYTPVFRGAGALHNAEIDHAQFGRPLGVSKLTVGSPCLQVYTCRRPAHPCLRAPQLSSTGAATS
jgi:hypothetical protein